MDPLEPLGTLENVLKIPLGAHRDPWESQNVINNSMGPLEPLEPLEYLQIQTLQRKVSVRHMPKHSSNILSSAMM